MEKERDFEVQRRGGCENCNPPKMSNVRAKSLIEANEKVHKECGPEYVAIGK